MAGQTHQTHTSHASHSHGSHAAGVRHAEAEEHKIARSVYQADKRIREVEVLASGNPRRIRRYFARKWAYKLFGKLMGKTINRL